MGLTEIVKELLHLGADVNATDFERKASLFYCMWQPSPIEMLLDPWEMLGLDRFMLI
jgi:hypothetical protein